MKFLASFLALASLVAAQVTVQNGIVNAAPFYESTDTVLRFPGAAINSSWLSCMSNAQIWWIDEAMMNEPIQNGPFSEVNPDYLINTGWNFHECSEIPTQLNTTALQNVSSVSIMVSAYQVFYVSSTPRVITQPYLITELNSDYDLCANLNPDSGDALITWSSLNETTGQCPGCHVSGSNHLFLTL